MFIVGLTGGIGTGKTTVCSFLKEVGIPILDADHFARKVVEPNKKAWNAIKKEFGESVLLPTGELNREALGDMIFSDVEKRRKLNEITHPQIYKEMLWAAMELLLEGHQFIVMDLPLLFESGSMLGLLHKIIVVTCNKEQQLERVQRRSGLDEERVKLRIEAQMPLDTKCEQAHFVLDNSGSIDDLKEQVEKVVVLLKSSRAHWKLRSALILGGIGVLILLLWLIGLPSAEF